MKITKQSGSFQAKSDNGELYTILEFKEYDSILTSAGTINVTETPVKKWTTSTGYSVSQIDTERYRIVRTNEVIRKV